MRPTALLPKFHKKGLPKPPTPVTETPSAAVMSGLFNTVPPVEEKFPGVIAVESALKKIRRRPSEVNGSTYYSGRKDWGKVQWDSLGQRRLRLV